MVRVKKRHILFQLTDLPITSTGSNITQGDIYVSIRNIVSNLYGTIGSKYMQNFSCQYFNIYTKIGYFSCLHTHHRKVLAALNFVCNVGNYKTNFRTLHVSGTIKTCQRFLIKWHGSEIGRIKKDQKFLKMGEADKTKIEDSLKNDKIIENDTESDNDIDGKGDDMI